MNRSDISNAYENIDGDRATLKWIETQEKIDGHGTFRSSITETNHFVKENDTWVFGKPSKDSP